MVEENEINEIAIIFKRFKSDYELVEEFIPYKVVEGYYCEPEDCFVDSEQNVYSHIASLTDVGNAYAGRISIYDALKQNSNLNLEDVKKRLLEYLNRFQYFKNVDDTSDEYCFIKTKDKNDGTTCIFNDQDTAVYYEMYRSLRDYAKKHQKSPEGSTKMAPAKTKTKKEQEIKTPAQTIEEMKKTIKGQDKALETVVTLLWMRYAFPKIPKSNILLIGPSGAGKTAIFKKIKKISKFPVTMFSITGVSQTGYKGHDLEEMLSQLYYDSGEDIKKAEKGIIFIDEFDKIADNRDGGEIGTIAVQNELLKIIEGCERQISLDNHKNFNIDTTNIMFVCCGAFSELFEKKYQTKPKLGFAAATEKKDNDFKITSEDIISQGIIRELVGRLPVIVELNDISNDRNVLRDILLNSDESLFNDLVKALKTKGVKINNLNDIIDYIIDDAISKKLGARGLFGPTRNIFLKIFYEVANNPNKYGSVTMGENIINDFNDFKLEDKKVKKRVKSAELNK